MTGADTEFTGTGTGISLPGFGMGVRERRRAMNLTQKKLARLLGCSPVTVQKIEEGHRRPAPPLAQALARHLEIGDVDTFLRQAREASLIPRAARASAEARGQQGPDLPLALTPLLGRAPERRTLAGLLTAGPRRLLTVTGPPGVGKTRLALELARDLQPAFGEVHFIPLAAVQDSGQVWPQIARHLGLALGARPPLERVVAHLGRRRALLVLDNFEHVLEAAPGLSTLLAQAPAVRVLVTSRAALHLSGEQVWPLSPLALPEPGTQTPAQLRRLPAVALFVERATAGWPEFRVQASNAADVARIVRWCGGLPLALELAAGRIGPLSPAEVRAALEAAPLALLDDGPRDLPSRQRSVHAAIAWTYERLDAVFQHDFRHLGIFVGGFGAGAAGALGVARPALDALLRLNLLRRADAGNRYSLLEPLRAFALDRLKAHDEQHAAAHAHADHLLQQQGDLAWHDLPWVEAELDNLRAALRWAIDHAHTDTALRLVLGVSWYLEINSLQREEVGWFEAALALPGGDADLRLHALMRGATPAWQLGRHAQARDWLHAALPAVQERPWPEGEFLVLITLARVEIESGHPQAALLHLHAGLRLPPAGEGARASLLFHLADANVALGQPGRARAYVHEGLGVCREQ
ncbi:helix-turn-helix domain-containing protein, partial [Deinococcus sp.]|uniref:ATP-binding protein n=1 Tax=Deinococcus sp. TaxID=47478 RepID=UPI0028698ABD